MNLRVAWIASFLLAAGSSSEATVTADEIRDVTFSTPYASGRPKTANFYYCDRAIGAGREGFQAIVERIGQLPPGTSIAWGPNYDRCGECSGAEPGCVPKFLYPDLWDKLAKTVKDRQMTLSSRYPNVRQMAIQDGRNRAFPEALPAGAERKEDPFDAVLDWEIGPRDSDHPDIRQTPRRDLRSHRFSTGGNRLEGYDLELFLGRLPEKSRVLLRLSVRKETDPGASPDERKGLAREIRSIWYEQLAPGLRAGELRATLVASSDLVATVNAPPEGQPRLRISWWNFRGPETAHQEVLHMVDGRLIGRGDKGFDELLAILRRLPPGSPVQLPRYRHRGRYAVERMSPDELAAANARLVTMVPYTDRQPELEQVIDERKLSVSYSEISPPGSEANTVLAWGSGDRHGRSFVSSGRIIRHGEQPRPPAARLAWTKYVASARFGRKPESTAAITVDDVELGTGVTGFARAMAHLGQLPAGSVVQVRICLRTKGPFLCPIIFAGQRHFERTGYEPYFGLLPWLIEVASERKLEIEWIPDEEKSCQDCELNK